MIHAPASACLCRNLRAYRHAHALASVVFWTTRRFPPEERTALIAQMRQTSQALQGSVAQAWEVRYEGRAFRYHTNMALRACSHLVHWIHFARHRGYLSAADHTDLISRIHRVRQVLRRLKQQRIGLLAAGSPRAVA